MDKEHIEGAAKRAEGQVKETAGKLTGNRKLEAEGKLKKAEGEARETIGNVKDAMKKK